MSPLDAYRNIMVSVIGGFEHDEPDTEYQRGFRAACEYLYGELLREMAGNGDAPPNKGRLN